MKQVALKKSKNIPPKLIHKDLSKKINTFKFTESKKNLDLSTKLEGWGVYMFKKLRKKSVVFVQDYSVSLKLTFFLAYQGNIR